MDPLIWIIDEEWPEYDIEKEMFHDLYPGCTIKFSAHDYQQDLHSFGIFADVILCQIFASIPGEVIQKLKNCKGIAVYGGGYDRVDTATAREMGISVTNVSDYCKEDVAEYTMASIYHLKKQILSFEKPMREGRWAAQAVQKPIHRIKGTTLLVIGLGRIGKAVAEKAKNNEMRVIAYDPYVNEILMHRLGIAKVSWNEGLESADFVSVNAILNDETTGMFKYDDFKKMKRTSYLINTARGKIIVEQDLIRALNEKLISGAILDVIAFEPPTTKEKIFDCEGIIITPHISYFSNESYLELKKRTIENAVNMLENRVPRDLVN
jgi:phosphoglycerate dehydrogenase-like enzyme